MKALKHLRMQLIKDYPGDTPVFGEAPTAPEEYDFFYDNTVIPAFEKIEKEFKPFHFKVKIDKFVRTTRIKIGDGCSKFVCYIRIHPKYACVVLEITYFDQSIYNCQDRYSYSYKTLIEEKFDLSKVSQDLTEELIVTIVSDTFINRKEYLKRITEIEINEINEKAELLREERRARLIELKNNNDLLDSADQFKEILGSERFSEMMRWIDIFFMFNSDSDE